MVWETGQGNEFFRTGFKLLQQMGKCFKLNRIILKLMLSLLVYVLSSYINLFVKPSMLKINLSVSLHQ